MDGFKWSTTFEFLRIIIGMLVIYFQEELLLTDNPTITLFLLTYLVLSVILNFLILKSVPSRIS